MKTNSPNVLFNHQTKLLFEKTSQVMKQKLLLILMLVSFYTGTFAQSRLVSQNGPIVVTEMNSVLFSNASGRVARQSSASSRINVERLKALITELQASTYFYGGDAQTYDGDQPTNLYTDLASLNRVNNSITVKQKIELVTIRINTLSELNSTIDLSVLSNFPSLKYIYFISGLNTTSETIASHIANYDSRYNIFYKIDKGDSNQ